MLVQAAWDLAGVFPIGELCCDVAAREVGDQFGKGQTFGSTERIGRGCSGGHAPTIVRTIPKLDTGVNFGGTMAAAQCLVAPTDLAAM